MGRRVFHGERPVAKLWIVLVALTLPGLTGACDGDALRRVALPAVYAQKEKQEQAQPRPTAQPIAPKDSPWAPFERDFLHDPDSPAFPILQRPAEALKGFPRDVAGNYVDWVKALEQGHIRPRTNLYEETDVNILDLDIYMDLRGSMPIVKFPHRQHTMWLDCKNCHDGIFKAKTGANKITMVDILNGKFCGQCHGAVSFPLTECLRCHSVSHAEYERLQAETQARKGR